MVMRKFQTLVLANSFACLVLVKFGLLILYDWANGSNYFGQYALAHGLIAGLFTLAGFQARMFVLSKIRNVADLGRFQIILIGAAGIAAVITIGLNQAFPSLAILALVCAQRGLENLMLARASFSQIQSTRKIAFQKLNQYGIIIVGTYAVALFWSLEFALLAEVAVLLFTIWHQRADISTGEKTPSQGYIAIGVLGVAFSLSAGLNAGLNSALLYFAHQWFSLDGAMALAQILAVQAMLGRLMVNNSVFFLQEISNALSRSEYLVLVIWVGLASTMLSLHSIGASIILMGAIFTCINAINILLRQHIMATSGPKALVQLHGLEIIGFVLFAFWAAGSIETLFFIFICIRTIRIPILLYLRHPMGSEALS